MNILVLCTGNSARSILLEAVFNAEGKGVVTAYSAGSQPSGKVHPQSLKLLGKLGYGVSELRSKSWDEFAVPGAPEMDVVITVCGSAANETCPIWPGHPVQVHWGVEDPAKAAPEDWDVAFQSAYDTLRKRALTMLGLPLQDFTPEQLKRAIEPIGHLA